jgi:hypothetical protein
MGYAMSEPEPSEEGYTRIVSTHLSKSNVLLLQIIDVDAKGTVIDEKATYLRLDQWFTIWDLLHSRMQELGGVACDTSMKSEQ